MTWPQEARRPGRIPLDIETATAWEKEVGPWWTRPHGQRPVWEHEGHRFEVIDYVPVPPDLKGRAKILLAVPLDDGPGGCG